MRSKIVLLGGGGYRSNVGLTKSWINERILLRGGGQKIRLPRYCHL